MKPPSPALVLQTFAHVVTVILFACFNVYLVACMRGGQFQPTDEFARMIVVDGLLYCALGIETIVLNRKLRALDD